MPNWCIVNITFTKNHGAAPEELLQAAMLNFHNMIVNQMNNKENLFPQYKETNSDWEGNFVLLGGLISSPEQEIPYHVRGNIIDYSDLYMNDEYFQIEQEDAWTGNLVFWWNIILKNYCYNGVPMINMFWKEVEPGLGIYSKNDPSGNYYPEEGNVNIYYAFNLHNYTNDFNFYSRINNSPFFSFNREVLDFYNIDINNTIIDTHDIDKSKPEFLHTIEYNNDDTDSFNNEFLGDLFVPKNDPNETNEELCRRIQKTMEDNQSPCPIQHDNYYYGTYCYYNPFQNSSIEEFEAHEELVKKLRDISTEFVNFAINNNEIPF